jgi:hypothetical protein
MFQYVNMIFSDPFRFIWTNHSFSDSLQKVARHLYERRFKLYEQSFISYPFSSLEFAKHPVAV